MAVTERTSQKLQGGQLGLSGVIMPALAQVAPAFNLFFTTGVMVALAGASAPLIFLISMVAMGATASSLAQFAGVYPSAGSFITYITRSIGTRVATAIGVTTSAGRAAGAGVSAATAGPRRRAALYERSFQAAPSRARTGE